MRRRSILVLSLGLAVILLGTAVDAQVRGTGRRVLGERSATVGGDLVSVQATGNGWGWLLAEDLEGQSLISIEGRVCDLDPQQQYSLAIDGKHILDLYTDRYGDAELQVVISSDSALLGSYGTVQVPGVWSAGALRNAAVLDSDLQDVLAGKLAGPMRTGIGHTTIVYEERIGLQDLLGSGVGGMARIEHRSDGSQLVETGVDGLQPGALYSVLLDGVPVGKVSADSEGTASVRLSSKDSESPLPSLLQPVEELKLVQWTATNQALLASGAFSGTCSTRTVLLGTVESVAETSFVLAPDSGAEPLTVLTNEQTEWGGKLSGISDLEPGLPVLVRGALGEDGSVLAWYVAAGEQIPDELVFLTGHVQSVADSAFVIRTNDAEETVVTVLVDERTHWRGGLSGIGDLEVEALVSVFGTPNDDGSVLARWVAGREVPPQLRCVPGTVESVGDASFVLLPDAGTEPLTVTVNDETRWGGSLDGIADLQPGLHVIVQGEPQDDGSLLALLVTDEQPVLPVRVTGTVDSLGDSSFELVPVTAVTGSEEEVPELVTVVVDEATRWGGVLSSFADLEPGMQVHVEGKLLDDGSILAWHVIARDDSLEPVFASGTVESVGDSGFVLVDDEGTTLHIVVNGHTSWLGTLSGLGDLEPGMRVHVRGVLRDDGTVLAHVVASVPEPTVAVVGTVESVGEHGFTMIREQDTGVQVLVDERTRWAGAISGLADLEPGMRVHVTGVLQDDGSVLAQLVAGAQAPPVILNGTVETVGDTCFTLIEGTGGSVSVQVDQQTRWAGDLSGLADLEPGMLVHVQGVLQDDGSVLAKVVASRLHTVVLDGAVEAVGESGFTLIESEGGSVSVQVDAQTHWAGGLSGLADLEPDMLVRVEGVLQDDGTVLARVVAGRQQQHLVLSGTVETIGNSGFTLSESGGGTVHVDVTRSTTWAGGLSGFADLEPGMQVQVEGKERADGSVVAFRVTGEAS